MTKFFLDTNAFYLLAGVTSYKKFSIDDLFRIIGKNCKEIYISNLTIFELLNNKIMRDKYDVIFKNLEEYDIWVLSDEDCTKFYKIEEEQTFRELFSLQSRVSLKNKIGKYVAFKYSENISLIIELIFSYYYGFAYYADFEEHNYYYFRYEDLISNIGHRIGQYYIDKSYCFVNSLITTGIFQEKKVKQYISDVLSSLIVSFVTIFNKIASLLNEGNLTWKLAYYETKKWFDKLNLDKLKTIKGNYDRINIFKEVFKENSKLIDNMIRNYTVENEDSVYKKQFMKKYIFSILKSNFNCSTNDFIDELIFELYDTLYIEDICFISLDKKYLKFLTSLENNKIKKSINYINLQIGDIFKLI